MPERTAQPQPPKGNGPFAWVPNPFSHAWGAVKGVVGGAIAGAVGPFRDAWFDAQMVVLGSQETRLTSLMHFGVDLFRMSLLWVEVPVNVVHGAWHGFVHPESALNPPNVISRLLHRGFDDHPSHQPVMRTEATPAFKPREIKANAPQAPAAAKAPRQAEPPSQPLGRGQVNELKSAVRQTLYDDRDLMKNDMQYREWKRWMSENRTDYLAKFEQMAIQDRLRCIQRLEASEADRNMLLHANNFTEGTERNYARQADKQFDALLNEGLRETQKREEALTPILRNIDGNTRPQEVVNLMRDAAERNPELAAVLKEVVTRPEVAAIILPVLADMPREGGRDAPRSEGAINQVWERIISDPLPLRDRDDIPRYDPGSPPSSGERDDRPRGGYDDGSSDRGDRVRPQDVPEIARGIQQMADGDVSGGLQRVAEQAERSIREQQEEPSR